MTYRNLTRTVLSISFLSLLVGGLFAGCSSDNTNSTPNSGGGDAGSGGEDAKGGKSSAKGGSSGKGGSSSTDGGAGDGGATDGGASSGTAVGGSSATGGATSTSTSTTCTPDTSKNCYSCPPVTSTQTLNACNSSGARPGCSPYDNSKLTKLVNGKVPALP